MSPELAVFAYKAILNWIFAIKIKSLFTYVHVNIFII